MPAPTNPAPVSGPGRLARRTDGPAQPVRNLPNAQYGEAAEYRTLQQGAPLAKAPAPGAAPRGNVSPGAGPSPTRFTEGTLRPDEPVTAGSAMGPGPGPAALGLPPGPDDDLRLRLHALYSLYPTEDLRRLLASMEN